MFPGRNRSSEELRPVAENSRISVSRCQGHFKKLSVETAVMEGKKKAELQRKGLCDRFYGG